MFIFTALPLNANPYYSSDIKLTGYGFLEIVDDIAVYTEPSTNSEILTTLELSPIHLDFEIMGETPIMRNQFLARDKNKKSAFVMVLDEAENGWFQICYNQEKKSIGWVQSKSELFYSLLHFYLKYGKKNGVYVFRDIPAERRKLYAKPYENKEDMKLVDEYDYAHKIKLVIIKGNWMLVRILDVNNKEKIGYLRWRENDGRLLAFPLVK